MSPDDHAFSPGARARNIDSGARIVPSVCPHDCTSTCALDVERLDAHGRSAVCAARMRNDYTAGVICEKVARYAERIHHPDRLMKPLRRIGPKGSKQFAEISWSDALDIVAEQFIAKAALSTAPKRSGHITTPAPWAWCSATASTACATR